MALRDHFTQNSEFVFKNNIFYQREFSLPHSFENTYLELRDKEERMYSDEIIKKLPAFPKGHPLKKEWSMRKSSLMQLLDYLKKRNSHDSILELGCGNGWLANNVANSTDAEVCAMDINETELTQGAKIFTCPNLFFVHGDIFDKVFDKRIFDVIILAGTIQYFPDLKTVINKLLTLLKHLGEIHIFDSPLYHHHVDINSAKLRSANHFNSLGLPMMSHHYHYHDWDSLSGFNYEVLNNPRSLINKMKRKIITSSPFPWIKIS